MNGLIILQKPVVLKCEILCLRIECKVCTLGVSIFKGI